ncbi:hypothetical protein KXV52_006088 [Aspergillus fumigatus]|nr:hypothetical protein KXX11_000795 [Aspergillus fumigatus]KAH1440517.1 hypothetical protein KXX13_006940 [Aspergillus fumigatus]KAH1515562.1 hypothetical protein KXX29_009755 [Aspergillus fumigatus]KAH1597695.1 hypothetical protein KXX44_005988 [Aspergillus fumigatus]KAH1628933.1 hypothetical protein KXX21_005184 [Aspergillus fumigatus]
MSGPGEERWRGGRPQDQNRQSGQRHSNSRNMGAHSGNRGGQSPAPWSDSRDQLATGPSQEHVPVRGFNSAELKAALRRGPGEPKPFFYRPNGKDANSNRASGPWGAKPNTMANGKDFFLELRKQSQGEGKIYGGGTVIKPSLKQGFSGHGQDEESRICWLQLALAGYYQSEPPGQCDT